MTNASLAEEVEELVAVSLDEYDSGDATWILTSAFIILTMQSGFGLLETGNLVEVQRSDLVAGHIGQTAAKTREKIEEAKGGVLFIDEAYTLVGRGEKDFGIEAIEEIMRVMNEGDPVCIFAGYKGEMSEFIEANPGLYRRITRKFNFNDYTAAQLADMTSKYSQIWDVEGAVDASLGAKRVMHEIFKMKIQDTGKFVNCEDGLDIPW